MSSAHYFALDSFAVHLNTLTKKMARTLQVTAAQLALTAQEARLLIKEIILTGPSRMIDRESAWIACHSSDTVTVLGEKAVITASIDGSHLRWLRCAVDKGISWHIDFNTGPGEVETLLDSLFSTPIRPAYLLPQLCMRVRVINGSTVIADYSFDEFSEHSTDERDWKSRLYNEISEIDDRAGVSADPIGEANESEITGQGTAPSYHTPLHQNGTPLEITPLLNDDSAFYTKLSLITTCGETVCARCGNHVSQGASFCSLCGYRLPRIKNQACGEDNSPPECSPQGISFVKKVLTTINTPQETALKERFGSQ